MCVISRVAAADKEGIKMCERSLGARTRDARVVYTGTPLFLVLPNFVRQNWSIFIGSIEHAPADCQQIVKKES
jgi:hypothetical protein